MFENQISIDNIFSFGGFEILIDKNLLTCPLCYCLNFNAKQCLNKKCLKLICGNCYNKNLLKFNNNNNNNNKKNFKCFYCMSEKGFIDCNEELKSILNKIKYFCNFSRLCTNTYDLNIFIKEHNHPNFNDNNNNDKCHLCKKIISIFDINCNKCSVCNNLCCYTNVTYQPFDDDNNENNNNKNINSDCLEKCFKCKSNVCLNCKKNKDFINDFICDNCEEKCFLCKINLAENVCYICKNFLCNYCVLKCEICNVNVCKNKKCLIEKSKKCKNCMKIDVTNNNNGFHYDLFKCKKCYVFCECCKSNVSNKNCSICYKRICFRKCSNRCKRCHKFSCKSCMFMCNICKKIFCKKCVKICSNCNNQKLISCLNCNSDNIRKCSFLNCEKNLCINCWNTCNFCLKNFCSNHSLNCGNCEESICNNHYNLCKKCAINDDDKKYKKCCIKKCTFKCNFCENVVNLLCKKENHKNNFVEIRLCEHNVCESCLLKCENCMKIISFCPSNKCNLNYYYKKCNFCLKYLCSNCAKNCNVCKNDFCNLRHMCQLCLDICENVCQNCEMKKKIFCKICKQKNKICEICKNKFICGQKCYLNYVKNYYDKNSIVNNNNNSKHLCVMYYCKKHLLDFFEEKISKKNYFKDILKNYNFD